MRALREDRIGRYELLIELARGGMAELFLGRLHGAGGFAKLVAIKRILPHLADDKQFKEMFLNEGRIAAHLSHPNVCQVFELDESENELYLAMEYLDGVSWDHLTREVASGNFAMRLGIGVMVQACEGLHYAHALRDAEGNAMQVVHRDVSPQNLFVTVDGVCKVLDFGVSKVMTDGPRTKSGVIKGKLPYMAPEQIRGEAIDGRADVFALGVCMWEALAAQRLFDRPTDFLIWKAITEEDVPSIQTHWDACPPALDAVVRRALDREPANRFATAREFADALRAACPFPPCTPAEIADAVRARCGDRILERQREVATALSARRAVPDLDTAATTDRGIAASMEIRQQSVTLDLRTEAKRARLAAEEEAAETRDLRRDAAETRTVEPPAESLVEPLPKSRGHWRMLLVAILAAAATAVLVVVLMRREERTPVVQQQAPAPEPERVVTPAPADAAAPVVVETPVDAAPVVTTTPKRKKVAKKKVPAPIEEVDTTEADNETMGVHEAAETTKRAGEDLRKSMEQLRDSLQR